MNGKQTTLLTLIVAILTGAGTALILTRSDLLKPNSSLIEIRQKSDEQLAGTASSAEADSKILLQSLVKEMAEMRSQISKLEQQKSTTTIAQEPPLTEEDSTLSQAEQDKQREAAAKAQQALLENSLKRQSKDPAWGRGAQNKLSSAYNIAISKGVRFIDADCRSTMCQVKIELDRDNTASELELRKMMDKPAPWSGTRMMHVDRHTGEVTMYMMREGHQLPTLAEYSPAAQ